jgi:hypothetical protein
MLLLSFYLQVTQESASACHLHQVFGVPDQELNRPRSHYPRRGSFMRHYLHIVKTIKDSVSMAGLARHPTEALKSVAIVGWLVVIKNRMLMIVAVITH